MGGQCRAIRSRRLLKYSLCGEAIEEVGLLSPTCHHAVSRPCSLLLPISRRQSEQKQSSFSLSCHATSTGGPWTPAPSPPALQVCASAGWLFYTHLQTHLRSQTTPSSTSFPLVLPLWCPGPLPPPSFNPLPLALHPSFRLLVRSEGWSVAAGHEHAHKHLCSQAPRGRDAALHAFLLSLQSHFTISPKLESERHENLCLCSKSLKWLHVIYLHVNTKPQRSSTGSLVLS